MKKVILYNFLGTVLLCLLFWGTTGCNREDQVEPPPSDKPPTVSISSPQPLENETLCGLVTISAEAQAMDGKSIDRLEFSVDDVLLADGVDTTAPYAGTWDTATVLVTGHTIKVKAVDSGGYSAEASLAVNVWCGEEKRAMPTQRYYFSTGVVAGKIYVIGGYNPAVSGGTAIADPEVAPVFNVVEEYDPASDTWTTKAPIPGQGRAAQASCVIDGKIYIFGGDEGYNWVPYVDEYDPATDTWISKAPIPQEKGLGIGLFTCSAVQGRAYIIGGLGAEDATAVGEYNPVKDRWIIKEPMQFGRYSPASAAVKGKIYVLGGCPDRAAYTCPNAQDSIEVYDPVQDGWSLLASSMPTPRFGFSTCLLNGRIYAIGGVGASPEALAVIEDYDPLTDTWSTHLPMPTGQKEFGLAVVNGKIYIIGTKVYEYRPGLE